VTASVFHLPFRAALLLAAALLSQPAFGHSGGTTGMATVTVDGGRVRYDLTLPDVPPGALADQMQLGRPDASPDYRPLVQALSEKISIRADGRECHPAEGKVTPPSATAISITGTVSFDCPATVSKLEIADDLPDVLGADHHTIALIVWPGGSHSIAFGTEMREASVTIGTGSRAMRGAGSFFLLGIEHILTGYDHLLFLLVLILAGGSLLQLLKIVTAFTLAHTVTLGLAAYDVVTLPGPVVEAVIALSIAYVAAENLFPKYAISRRWTISFVFGLVHGFGFSSVLKEIGLPKENLLLSLLNFNLGVEAGQAVMVVLALPLLLYVRRRPWARAFTIAVSAVVLAVGVFLFAERALFA
jgi:hypothetical protein